MSALHITRVVSCHPSVLDRLPCTAGMSRLRLRDGSSASSSGQQQAAPQRRPYSEYRLEADLAAELDRLEAAQSADAGSVFFTHSAVCSIRLPCGVCTMSPLGTLEPGRHHRWSSSSRAKPWLFCLRARQDQTSPSGVGPRGCRQEHAHGAPAGRPRCCDPETGEAEASTCRPQNCHTFCPQSSMQPEDSLLCSKHAVGASTPMCCRCGRCTNSRRRQPGLARPPSHGPGSWMRGANSVLAHQMLKCEETA